jgi:hypothetical protein
MLLTAVDELMLCLPKALLDPNRPFGEFVFASEGMQANIPPEGETFSVWLQPGMSISLAQSVESYVHAEDKKPRRVKITPPPAPPTAQVTTEQIICEYGHLPIALSIEPIAISLARHRVLVPVDDATTKQAAVAKPKKVLVKTGKDNQGSVWAYAYTNRQEFSRVFPARGGFAEMSFKSFFDMIEPDGQIRGIVLNSGSDTSFYIPRELFETVKQVLPGRDRLAD